MKSKRLISVVSALIFVVSVSLSLGSAGIVHTPKAQAFVEGFNPSLIISDDIFYNAYSMDAAGIQIFLNQQVPYCRTAEHDGPQNPCLKDFRDEGAPSVGADEYCQYIEGGNLSAAEIIERVSRACGINPQVILVTLQKEQSLVTDDWPRDDWHGNYQYRTAMGFGCPDSAACDPSYWGFFNQIYYAARQFQKYRMHPGSYNFQAGTVRTIDNAMTFIANQATAGLYNYTPHFHGNENFYIFMTRWFPTVPRCYSEVGIPMYRMYNPSSAEHLYTANPVEADSVAIGGWQAEGCAWNAPTSGQQVYRLFNPYLGDHHYTTDAHESYVLQAEFWWIKEDGGWFSGGSQPVYRLFNPGLISGSHHYTKSAHERDELVANYGWIDEGVGWYGD